MYFTAVAVYFTAFTVHFTAATARFTAVAVRFTAVTVHFQVRKVKGDDDEEDAEEATNPLTDRFVPLSDSARGQQVRPRQGSAPIQPLSPCLATPPLENSSILSHQYLRTVLMARTLHVKPL